MHLPFIGLIVLLASSLCGQARYSGIGELCPELEFEGETIQGPCVCPTDLYGRVVLCELYAMGCRDCEQTGLGLLQEAYVKYADDPNVLIFAIAVDTAAWKIDVDEVRDRASCKGWTMPIVKDRDNSSQEHFYIDIPRWGRNPSSTSVFALDLSGQIIAHNTASNDRAFNKVLRAFEKEVERSKNVLVPSPFGLDASFDEVKKLIASNNYGDAYAMLEEIEADLEAGRSEEASNADGAEDRELEASLSTRFGQVRYVKALIENSFDRRWKSEMSNWLFDPPSAVNAAEVLMKSFGRIVSEPYVKHVAAMKSSLEYEEFEKMQKRYDIIHQQIQKLGGDASEKQIQSITAALEQLKQDASGTKIEHLACEVLKGIQ